MKKSTKRICSLVLIALAVVLLFILDGHKNEQGMLISILQKSAILAIVAVAMNLLNGFTGLFSLGQAGFMSIGAYVTAILMIPVASLDGVYYMNGVAPGIRSMKEAMEAGPAWLQAAYPFLALIAGGLIAAAFAALIGIPVLRLKSDYLAIATLGFSEIIRAVFSSPQMDTITNGSYGLNKVPTFPKLFGLPVLFTPFIIAAVCIALMVLLINSTYGRAFKAIREDEIAAEAMGVN
ncbi:branched-chain amino acid ABC transporter permease, partial [Anaerotruncus colihominis]